MSHLNRRNGRWQAAATAGAVRVSLEKHILPVLGRHRLAALRRTDIEALRAWLEPAPSTVCSARHLRRRGAWVHLERFPAEP